MSRRAELRQVRPTRGSFPVVGCFVFYYDQTAKAPGPNCWRGLARVVGKEGSRTIWLSHRGILIAVSPEHLASAFDKEVAEWNLVNNEVSLLDMVPASGGAGSIDLRKAPLPDVAPAAPEGDGEGGQDEARLPDGEIEQPAPGTG